MRFTTPATPRSAIVWILALAPLTALMAIVVTGPGDAQAAQGRVAGVTVATPAHALPPGAKLRVTRARGRLPELGYATRVSTPVSVRLQGARHTRVPLRLRVAVSRVDPADVRLGRVDVYRRTGRTWAKLPTRALRRGRAVGASISRGGTYAAFSRGAGVGFSIGDVVSSLGDALTGMVHKFNRFTGNAGPVPNCAGKPGAPSWADFTGDAHVTYPLMSCARGEGDVIAVEITNNRPYGVIVSFPVPVRWAWVDDGVHLKQFTTVPLRPIDGLYIAPTSRASVGIARGDWQTASFIGAPTQRTVFLDVLQTLLDEAGVKLSGQMTSIAATRECGEAFYTLADAGLDGGSIKSKMVEAADAALQCVTSAIAKRYLKPNVKSATMKRIKKLGDAIGLAQFVTQYGALIVALKWEISGVFSIRDRLWKSPVARPPAPIDRPPSRRPEKQGRHGVNTFRNYHNASGLGPRISPHQTVDVSCKVLDTTIASANPDGYWYRIASAPWNDQYYAPANTFYNGDPESGPYTHNTDFAVPDC